MCDLYITKYDDEYMEKLLTSGNSQRLAVLSKRRQLIHNLCEINRIWSAPQDTDPLVLDEDAESRLILWLAGTTGNAEKEALELIHQELLDLIAQPRSIYSQGNIERYMTEIEWVLKAKYGGEFAEAFGKIRSLSKLNLALEDLHLDHQEEWLRAEFGDIWGQMASSHQVSMKLS